MNKILINNQTKVNQALKIFDKLGGQCLYVIKKNKFLVGSLTDGDWRRASLKGKSKNVTVEEICNKSPFKINKKTSTNKIKKILSKNELDSIPLVNKKNLILKIIFKNQLLEKKIIKKLSTPIIIMAGGKGTRLSPFTEVLPKPLIPIKGKTVISRIIQNFIAKGFKKFFISINEKSKIIKSYFEEKNFRNEIRFIEEKKPLGTAGALSKLHKINSKNFFVTNCDTIIDYDISKIIKHHNNNKNSLTILVVKKNYSIPYGVCKKNTDDDLIEITEKPKLSYLINIGSYVLNKETIKLLKKNTRYDFNNFVKILKKNKKKVGVYKISEKRWRDVGTWEEYKKSVSLMK
tara:strand:+ start:612 stop:1652 length:1041 start_codon:yes stop_codon:yes gene_type:complete